MKNMIFKKNIVSFYISVIMITIASSLPHSVLTVLLLKKNLSLSQIMIIQAIYSFAVLISEYPSGLLADIYSKKKLFIISKLFLIVMFTIVLIGKGPFLMALAWFCYGISGALDSGTIDAEIINDLKKYNAESKVSKFISTTNRFNFLSLLIGSTLGSWMYYQIGIRFYFISIILTIFSMFIIQIAYQEHNDIHNNNNNTIYLSIRHQIITGWNELQNSFNLKLMIALTFVSQFFFQTHYQIWQALFLFKGFNKKTFFIYYIIFQLISFVAYGIPIGNKISERRSKLYFLIISFIMIGSIIFISNPNKVLFISSYLILVFVFTFFDYFSNVLFSKTVSIERISSLTSLKSSCGRIASLISLLISGALLTFLSVSAVVIINFFCAILFSLLILILFITKKP